MLINLVSGFSAAGHPVDLLLVRANSEHLQHLSGRVRVVKLPSDHTIANVFALRRYLDRERPAALLAAKHRAIKTAVLARSLARHRPRLVGRLGTNVSGALAGKDGLRQWAWRTSMRATYRHVDRLVCVSDGVAEDVLAIADLDSRSVRVVRNPVITPQLHELAAQPISHPWFAPDQPPVIVAAGRLTEQKDFSTLLRAFARLREARVARLVVLGEGAQRPALEKLSAALKVDADVDFPGFVANPYPFMAQAAAFVLSSRWEGSPNVLTEALALGTPAVATDCPSGPREILQDGRICPLVAVGDDGKIAAELTRLLDAPPEPERLREAVADYQVDVSVDGYLAALGL
jgi:glycosyltransferase involved in cell wall biosynthesis